MKLSAKILLGYMASEANACPFQDALDLYNQLHHRLHWGAVQLTTAAGELITHANQEAHDSPFFDTIVEDELNGVPTAMFHGLGDFCENPGIIQIDRIIKRGTGGKTKCVDVGFPSIGEMFNNIEHVAEVSCQKLQNDPVFSQAEEFNVIGLSQGGLLARYIVEKCDMPGKVRNFVTLGGPHMGVAAVPHCFDGLACDVVNAVAKRLVYSSIVQDVLVPAGYFRDVNHYDRYLKGSVFLPAVNNEEQKDEASKFADLNGALLVMFSEDTMIYPKETAWFQGLDKDGNVLPLDQMDFYNDDYIGLKALNDAGKVKFESFEGDHLEFSTQQVEDIIVPFLKQ